MYMEQEISLEATTAQETTKSLDSKQSYSTGKTICSIMLCGLSVGCNFPQQRLQTEVESTLVRSPGLYINPDGDTGAFFRVKNALR